MSEICLWVLGAIIGAGVGCTVGTCFAFWQISRAKKREARMRADVANSRKSGSGRFTPLEVMEWPKRDSGVIGLPEAERTTNDLFAKAFASIKHSVPRKFYELTAEHHEQRKRMREQYEHYSREMAKIVATYPMFLCEQVSYFPCDIPRAERMRPYNREYQHNGQIIRVQIIVDDIETAPPLF